MKMLLALFFVFLDSFGVASDFVNTENVLDGTENKIVSEIILRSLRAHYSDIYKKTKDNLSKVTMGFSDESKIPKERVEIATRFILELENLMESDFNRGNIEGISDDIFNNACNEVVLKKSKQNFLSQRNICRIILPLTEFFMGGILIGYGVISLINDHDGDRMLEYIITFVGLGAVFIAVISGVVNWYSKESGVGHKEEERKLRELKLPLKKDELLSLAILKRNEYIRQYNDWSLDSKEESSKVYMFIENSEERLKKSFNVMLKTLKQSAILKKLNKELSLENEYNKTAPGIIFLVNRFKGNLIQNNEGHNQRFFNFINDEEVIESVEKMDEKDSREILSAIKKAKKEICKNYKSILTGLKNAEIVKCLNDKINNKTTLSLTE